jgi:hypothetical protein
LEYEFIREDIVKNSVTAEPCRDGDGGGDAEVDGDGGDEDGDEDGDSGVRGGAAERVEIEGQEGFGG